MGESKPVRLGWESPKRYERPPQAADLNMDQPLARPPPLRRYAPYVIAGVLILAGAIWLVTGARGRTYRVPADHVSVSTVTRGPFEDFIAVRATVAPFTTRYLTSEQGGVVKQLLVEDGAMVKAGQPLLVLSNAGLEMQVATREADTASQINALENTRLQLEESRFKYQHDLLDIEHQIAKLKGDLQRDKILLDGNAIAPAVYAQEQAEYAYQLKLREATVASRDTEQKVRAKQLEQLSETLSRLNQNIAAAHSSLDALTIRAPMDGQLTALDAEVGQSKPGGAVLGQVGSLDRFKLTAQIDEFYLNRAALGQTAIFTQDGSPYKATLSKIYPQVANGTFRVDLQFNDAAPRGISVGQAMDMKLELGGAPTATMIRNGPFYQDTGGNWLFVLAPQGTYAVRRNVRLGRRNPDSIEVLQGLAPGERVIVSGYDAFMKADRVELEKP